MVKKSKLSVIWNNTAASSFKNVYDHIKVDSYINAEKVREGIMKMVDNLPDHPQKHSPDKYKKNNNGSYRAFEKYSYRVAYKITEQEIRILRIRHVRQEPKEY